MLPFEPVEMLYWYCL